MKRLAAVFTHAALGAALLFPGKTSHAATTYALYLQPISSPYVAPGPNAVFQFRALIDIPPSVPGGNNGTVTLALGVAITYSTAVTGPTPVAAPGVTSNRSKFKFTPEMTDFAPLAALGITGTLLWDSTPPARSFSTASNGTLTYQGFVGHTRQTDPFMGGTLTVPAGTYTVGTFTIPITYAGIMQITLPGALNLGGNTSARDYINNGYNTNTYSFSNDAVLTFPNDIRHASNITVNAQQQIDPSIAGRIFLEGVDDFAAFTPLTGPRVTVHFRTPGTTTDALQPQSFVLQTNGQHTSSINYLLYPYVPHTYDIAYEVAGHLRAVVPNITVAYPAYVLDVVLAAGDANSDNVIDIGDFGILVNAYNSDVNSPKSGYDPKADFNYDGKVDIADFGILVNEYGNSGAE